MKRLRHPVRAIREPFGTAGLVVACVALILALTGAAFAAAGLTGKQKKEVEKIAKKFAGKPGAPGAPGAQGPAGPAGKDGSNGTPGAKGATGPQGSAGSAGAKGATGPAGESPEVVEEGGSLCGGKGGVVYEVEGVANTEAEICNGKEGQDGQPGEPWTMGGTLPPGATETGHYSYSGPPGKLKVDVEGTTQEISMYRSSGIWVPISFPIELPFELTEAHVHYGEAEEGGAFEPGGACPSESTFTPEAEPGELCVYQGALPDGVFVAIRKMGTASQGATKVGAFVQFAPDATAPFEARGTFAVTG